MRKDILQLLSEMLQGLQVPRSLNALGAATKPHDELRKRLEIFGWLSAEEIQAKLRAALSDNPTL